MISVFKTVFGSTTFPKTTSIAANVVVTAVTAFSVAMAALSGGCSYKESRIAKVDEVYLYFDYTIANRVSQEDLKKCLGAAFGAAMENPEVALKIAPITRYNNSKVPTVDSNSATFAHYFTEGRFWAQYNFPNEKMAKCASAASALIKDMDDYNRLRLSGSEFLPMITTLRGFVDEARRDRQDMCRPRRAIFIISDLAYQGNQGEFKTLPAVVPPADSAVKTSGTVYFFVPKGAGGAKQITDSCAKILENIRAMGYDVQIEDLGDFERISRMVLHD